jgi:cyclic beta-1,2-glucan synthetase
MPELECPAAHLAESHVVASRRQGRPLLLHRLDDQETLLQEAYGYFAKAAEAQRPLAYAGEWLLDNYHVVQQSLRQVRDDMPGSYYRRLPILVSAPLNGYPRVYGLAREMVMACESNLDLDRLKRFVIAYQKVAPLTIGEVWALPTMLRIGVVGCLTQAVARVAGLPLLADDVIPMAAADDDDATVANSILSLRMLATQDWKQFFEHVSLVEAVLQRDPAAVHTRMDFDSRDRYYKVIESLAERTALPEKAIAREALALAREAQEMPERSFRSTHVGYYLVDAGRAQLEDRLNYKPSGASRLRRQVLAHPTLAYLGAIALLSLLLLVAAVAYVTGSGGGPAELIGAVLLGALPALAASVCAINCLVTHMVPPRRLPRLDLSEGILAEYRTMVAIPALVSGREEIEALLQQLERHYLGNADTHLHFALLADLADAPQKDMPGDGELLEALLTGIETLRQRYGTHHFFLFYRERTWNPGEACWMGWERKRGKLVMLNRLLRGGESGFSVQIGPLEILPQVRYVITLDADTTLPRESARRLVATLAHPLNRPQLNPETGAVVAGYGVLQPRVEIHPASTNRSPFSRIFAGDSNLDLYTRAVSDVYQDLFGEGSYVGKGIYDVAAFDSSLAGRVPENALLSHDLFEGLHARAGLVTDIIVYEDYPPYYYAYARRLHRWARGDWQLLPWLAPRVPHCGDGRIPNIFSVFDRWRLFDNMRRSLLAPTSLALLLAGWWWLPGSALLWTLVVLTVSMMPLITANFPVMAQWRRAEPPANTPSVRLGVWRWLLSLVLMPYETLLMVDAVASTLARLFVTRRRLLQWTTSAHTIRFFGRERALAVSWHRMTATLLAALALAGGVALLLSESRPASLPVAAPFLLAWMASPAVAHWIGRPTEPRRETLRADQQRQLRCLARRTWYFFEHFVGPDGHWLPPDHFQEEPRGLVAYRTSPTNIGLLLLSTLAAYDLGYIGVMDLALRLRSTLDGMSRLQRFQGHLLNWYNTRSLEPLPPRYVSTVDSGNLLGCLLALGQGCHDVPHDPVLRWQTWQGLLDTLDVLSSVLEGAGNDGRGAAAAQLTAYLDEVRQAVLEIRDDPACWLPLLTRLGNECHQKLAQLLVALLASGQGAPDAHILRELRVWTRRVDYQLSKALNEVELLLPWMALMQEPPALLTRVADESDVGMAWGTVRAALVPIPTLDGISAASKAAEESLEGLLQALNRHDGAPDEVAVTKAWCRRVSERLVAARLTVGGVLIGFRNLCNQAAAVCKEMEFGFLFDRQRQVFHLGFNVDTGRLDPNHYDLLASEARLASLLAIARGQVPQSHWLHLARPVTAINGVRALLSWNGSMFEYLMPLMLVRRFEGTLLDQTHRAIVQYQIDYGRQKKVPWGISEAGYYGFDAQMNYQYRGFGVPGLGFKSGLGQDLVISPYASLLALSLQPQAVMHNIKSLVDLEMLGIYGFYESIDYTHPRLALGQESAIVRSFMAHHQGMILVSLANYLEDESLIERFHADPRVQSVELLLQERVPQQAPVEALQLGEAGVPLKVEARPASNPWRVQANSPSPQVSFLSNGRLGLLITSTGGGYSTWNGIDLTRWRADATLEEWGTWLYVQDRDSGNLWSAGLQPTGRTPESQEVDFYAHKAEFQRRDDDIALHMEIAVAPNDDVEIRCVTLSNQGDRPRQLALISYGEIALAPQVADRRHPAFTKLFVESEYVPNLNGLLFWRRPRSADEKRVYLVHHVVVERGMQVSGTHESDRARFLGRGRTPRAPGALVRPGWGLSGTTGATLDPIMALGQDVDLDVGSMAVVCFVTAAADSRRAALALAGSYQAMPNCMRVFDLARSSSELELHQLDLTVPQLEIISKLLSPLLYPNPNLRANAATLAANRKGQPGLWRYAISGDYPILLACIGTEEEATLVSELLQAHTYYRNRHIKIDLVILNLRDTSYSQELQNRLHRLIQRTGSDAWLNRRGGVFMLRAEQMSSAERTLLETAARVILVGERGSLARQLRTLDEWPRRLPPFVAMASSAVQVEPPLPLERPVDLLSDNGLGGFSADGREYVIYLEPGQSTPAPWINVIANPELGFIVSEAGSGTTWAGNSGENRLTPWGNDPVSDLSGEALYLRDEETGEVWSPTPLPAGAAAPALIRHGAGYSTFEHNSHGLIHHLRLFVVPDTPVKVVQLRLENRCDRNRRITATYYAEWVLGTTQEVHQPYVVPEFDARYNALLARNSYNEEFGERVAFLAASKEPHGLTTDRTEFLGRTGCLDKPAALGRMGLSGAVRAGLDPCAALQVHIWLAPGEVEAIHFLLGQGATRPEALQLVARYQDPAQIQMAREAVIAFWEKLLGTVTVNTPDPEVDRLLNRWLPYQALACRIWGRSALYQSSGAFGYRDQLQDVMGLTLVAPELARAHILDAAGRQFEAGDVLHWWHPPSGRGVRTRCSDDLLWLPFVTAHYVETTGDRSILAEQAPYLAAEPLELDEHERYGLFPHAAAGGTLYEHCLRALEKGSTSGAHKLPLIGSHDWNDGFSQVGVKGRGESIWLGWFLYATRMRFAAVCRMMGEGERAAKLVAQAGSLREAIETAGWDGDWYRRAYYDDGTPLGSAWRDEWRIDSLAQSWAVISGAAAHQRATRAIEAVVEWLVREDERLILLFAPPFDQSKQNPGYVKGYLPGIRENGGQYTHAALWVVAAFAELGDGERAGALFRLLNPITHSDTPEKAARYRVEPYVVAADVYSAPPHVGRGGWTWYTGSAGWMFRVGLEWILGLRRYGRSLLLNPCIPRNWSGFELTYRDGDTCYEIRFENPQAVNSGVRLVTLDGEVVAGNSIPLQDDGRVHAVRVLMGST